MKKVELTAGCDDCYSGQYAGCNDCKYDNCDGNCDYNSDNESEWKCSDCNTRLCEKCQPRCTSCDIVSCNSIVYGYSSSDYCDQMVRCTYISYDKRTKANTQHDEFLCKDCMIDLIKSKNINTVLCEFGGTGVDSRFIKLDHLIEMLDEVKKVSIKKIILN